MKKIILSLLIFISQFSYGQEMWGISNSNYSGNMGIFLNPSEIVGAPYKYEINLIAGDFFAENSYIYFPKDKNIVLNTIFGNNEPGKNYLFRNSTALQKGFGHTLIIGPSYIKNNGDWAWGLHSAFRSELSVLDVPAHLAYTFYSGFHAPEIFGVRFNSTPMSFASASWLELGGTYGRVYNETEKHYIKWAATGNLLIGFNGLYGDIQNLDYTVLDSSNVVFHNVNAKIGKAIDDSFIALRGAGLSTTLGATYMHKRKQGGFECNRSNDNIKKYDYRVGVSLIDLGTIRYFRKSEIIEIATGANQVWTGIDSASIGLENVGTTVVSNIGGSIREEGFYMWMPLAVSTQFDYSFTPKIYGNLSLVKRIHFTENQIARGDQMNLAVRYEKRKFEANLNYTLFEWDQPSLGLGIRYKWFVIGSDRLLQFIGLSDTQAFDFFFGFKFQFCKRPFSPGPDCAAFQ